MKHLTLPGFTIGQVRRSLQQAMADCWLRFGSSLQLADVREVMDEMNGDGMGQFELAAPSARLLSAVSQENATRRWPYGHSVETAWNMRASQSCP